MSKLDKLMVIWLIAGSSIISSYTAYQMAIGSFSELIEDLHCAPIVKVPTMEEAKKQVEMYQSAVRG